jgi:hypothetical protein
MVPEHRPIENGYGARAAAIGMIAIVVAAMIVALFGWHPWATN